MIQGQAIPFSVNSAPGPPVIYRAAVWQKSGYPQYNDISSQCLTPDKQNDSFNIRGLL